jgi:hypothetical protein
MGINTLPAVVPINAWVLDEVLPQPVIWPTLFTACPKELVQPEPAGTGIAALPDVEPINAWVAVPLKPGPATWPELLIPCMLALVNPLGAGITVTE